MEIMPLNDMNQKINDFNASGFSFNLSRYGELLIACDEMMDVFFRKPERLLYALKYASLFDTDLQDDLSNAVIRHKQAVRTIDNAVVIRAELSQILCGVGVARVLRNYAEVFAEIIPEIMPLFGFPQRSKYHNLDVWEHTIKTIINIPPIPILRLTMLLHDVGKPDCFTEDENGGAHFRGHPHKGAAMADVILNRLGYECDMIAHVHYLIDTHDGHIEPEKKCVKGWLDEAGPKVMEDVILVMIADAWGKTDEARDEWVHILVNTENMMNQMLDSGEWESDRLHTDKYAGNSETVV